MEREIKFRGKRIDNGKWVCGSLLISEGQINKGAYYICETVTSVFFGKERDCDIGGFYRVDPETVGQYTGQTDKNGAEIYEGDVLERDGKKWYAVLKYCGWQCVPIPPCYSSPNLHSVARYLQVIGSVHNNPELLEV